MKNKLSVLFAMGMLFSLFVSCEEADYLPCVKPSGTKEKEVFYPESFSAINLYLHANIEVSRGDRHSISIEAAPNILENIDVHSSGQTLAIDNTRCLRTRLEDIQIRITTPDLEKLSLSGSGNVKLDKGLAGEKITLSLAGSGKITAHDISFEHVDSKISGSGDIIVSGKTQYHNIAIMGSGDLNAFSLQSEHARIKIIGSGNAHVFVTQFLDARIAGSGNLWYKGSPEITADIVGSGDLYQVTEESSVVRH